MSRAAVVDLLSTAPSIAAGQVWASNALDTPSVKPCIVTRWEEKIPSFELRGTQGLTVWVHDEIGDYARINTILEWVKTRLTTAIHVVGSDGFTISQIDWTGDSPDLYDDGWRTITKNAGFRVISRPS